MSGSIDLGAALFSSANGDWEQGRNLRVAEGDSVPSGGNEKLSYYFDDLSDDYLGLVVYKNDSNVGEFSIYVDIQQIYIPVVLR